MDDLAEYFPNTPAIDLPELDGRSWRARWGDPPVELLLWASDRHPGYYHYTITTGSEEITTRRPLRADAVRYFVGSELATLGAVPVGPLQWGRSVGGSIAEIVQ